MASDSLPVADWLVPFFRKLQHRDDLSAEEQQAIIDAAADRLQFRAGEDLVSEGAHSNRSMLVISGYTCRYRLNSEGARQLTAIHVAGDFVDLQSFLLREMDHSVGALGDCTVLTFPHERLIKVTERFPHLTRLLWLVTLLDGAIQREWLVGMGRLSATQRTAHLICEIYRRLQAAGVASDDSFTFPLTQATLADAVGISAVHINRVIQDLRQRDLLSWEGGRIEIRDWAALAATAEFDEKYLHLLREPR
ncbi:MAG TPA: Crp/Fnr family transcriptional regulator [Devosia sp.]|jgi:CRP-like cAMP-binding protein|nr:Crp/Fnr family transcriptional regulator [Devosia sp.]